MTTYNLSIPQLPGHDHDKWLRGQADIVHGLAKKSRRNSKSGRSRSSMDLLETVPYNPEDTLAKTCSLVSVCFNIIFSMIWKFWPTRLKTFCKPPTRPELHQMEAPMQEANMASLLEEPPAPVDSDNADPWSACTWCRKWFWIYFSQSWKSFFRHNINH